MIKPEEIREIYEFMNEELPVGSHPWSEIEEERLRTHFEGIIRSNYPRCQNLSLVRKVEDSSYRERITEAVFIGFVLGHEFSIRNPHIK